MSKAVKVLNNDKVRRHIEIEIEGNLTEDRQIHETDLLAGETIVSQVIVNARVIRPLSFLQILMCILTFGLYWIYLKWCGCCRSSNFLLDTHKQRIALTSLNRVMLWTSHIEGTQAPNKFFCIRGSRELKSRTTIAWYRLEDMSFAQREVFRWQKWCTKLESVKLSLFFGKYPDQDKVTSKSMHHSNTVMRRVQAADAGVLFRLANAVTKAVIPFTGPWKGTQVLELYQTTVVEATESLAGAEVDSITSVEQVFTNLLQFEQILMQSRRVTPSLIPYPQGESDTNKYEITQKTDTHIVNMSDTVQVNTSLLAMIPGEEIIGSISSRERWRFMDVFRPLVLAAILAAATQNAIVFVIVYVILQALIWLLIVRKRLKQRSAMVLTTGRLIEVTVDSISGQMSLVGNVKNLEVTTRYWPLNQLGLGYIRRSKAAIIGHYRTTFGGLLVKPHFTNSNAIQGVLYGMSPRVVESTKGFLSSFARVPLPQCNITVQEPILNTDEDDYLPSNWIPIPGEYPLMLYSGENPGSSSCYPLFCGCLPNMMLKLCSCGVLPKYPHQQMLVSTHRLWGSARERNHPFCCSGIFGGKQEVIFWIPIHEVDGFMISGDVDVNETMLTRCLPCFKSLQAGTMLEIAALKKFPLFVNRRQLRPKEGMLEQSASHSLRAMFAQILLQRRMQQPVVLQPGMVLNQQQTVVTLQQTPQHTAKPV